MRACCGVRHLVKQTERRQQAKRECARARSCEVCAAFPNFSEIKQSEGVSARVPFVCGVWHLENKNAV